MDKKGFNPLVAKSLQNKAKNIIREKILPAFKELEEFMRDYYR